MAKQKLNLFQFASTTMAQPGAGAAKIVGGQIVYAGLVNATSTNSLRGWRDGAILGLLLGCGLRRSEVVGLNLDQLQSREGHWVIVNLVGKGGRLRTVPMPSWCKELVDTWLRHSGVSDGKVFRRVLKGGMLQGDGVTANVVWYAVKRCAGQLLRLMPSEPVAHLPSEPLYSFNSPDSNRQFRAQPTALGRFIGQPPDR